MKLLSIFAIVSVIVLGVLMGLSSLVDDNSTNNNSQIVKNTIVQKITTPSEDNESISSDTELLFKLPEEYDPYTAVSKLQGKEYNPPKKLTEEEKEVQEKELEEMMDTLQLEYRQNQEKKKTDEIIFINQEMDLCFDKYDVETQKKFLYDCLKNIYIFNDISNQGIQKIDYIIQENGGIP
jgi:hypothetical protein